MERISEIKFELTAEDLAECQQLAARENKVNVTSGKIIGVVLVVVTIADAIFSYATGMIGNNFVLMLLGLSVRLFLLMLLLYASSIVLNSIHKKLVNKMDGSEKNGVFCEHRLILTEKEFIELTDVNMARYSWQTVGEVSENEKFVMIPINLTATHIIPKRFFDDEKQIKNFIETVTEYRENSRQRFNPSYIASYELNS